MHCKSILHIMGLMKETNRTPTNEALERAIKHFGSLSEMARQMRLSGYQVIQHWRKAGCVPIPYCTELERLSGEPRDVLAGFPPRDTST